MYKVLIVDDESNIRELIKKYANFEGYDVYEATNGLEAIDVVNKTDPDIIIMDIMMPELDGFSAVKEIRKTRNIPIIMLSARGEEYDRLHGFDLGIDDYVVKPFSPKELMMRVAAILNRYHHSDKNQIDHIWTYQGLKIDLDARIVYVENERLEMTPKEYDLLIYLIKNKNILQSCFERISLISSSSVEQEKKYPVKVTVDIGKLTISCANQTGDAKEEIYVSTEGKNIEAGFNPKYFLDALKVIDDEEVYVHFGSSISPCIIRPVDEGDYVYMILPIRLKD